MNNNPLDKIMQEHRFSKEEKNAFLDILKYAKLSQKGNEVNLKNLIEQKIEEVTNNEVSKN